MENKKENKIPKIIHYCWFGGNPLPKMAKQCIDSWLEYLPDYEIKEWNEKNFDVNSSLYCKQAYDNKKWAFITDYVRLKVLYDYGGVYMDTDVEVVKNIDQFLTLDGFSGFESETRIPTGIMACKKGHPLFFELLKDYDNRPFVKEDGELDTTTNVTIITDHLKEYNIVLNNTLQTIADFTLFPNDYFCPKNCETNVLKITKNTYTIHHFDGSWIPKNQKLKYKILNLLGTNITNRLVLLKRKFIK